jgi:hypothetical protein
MKMTPQEIKTKLSEINQAIEEILGDDNYNQLLMTNHTLEQFPYNLYDVAESITANIHELDRISKPE